MAFPFIASGANLKAQPASAPSIWQLHPQEQIQDTVSFGGTNLTSTGDHNEDFIAKLDNNGNYLWVKQFTAQYIALRALNTLSDGSSIVSGGFKYNWLWCHQPQNTGDHYEGYIAKLDNNATLGKTRHRNAKYYPERRQEPQ